jgi:hypothetical protein
MRNTFLLKQDFENSFSLIGIWLVKFDFYIKSSCSKKSWINEISSVCSPNHNYIMIFFKTIKLRQKLINGGSCLSGKSMSVASTSDGI